MTGFRHIDSIISGPRDPNVVFWSGPGDPESWSRPKGNGSVEIAPFPRRGTRPIEMVVGGTDAFGERMAERVVMFLHWRKYKRMMRKMGRCR